MNKKYTITLDLQSDEALNQEIDRLLEARITERIRANCQSVIDNAVNEMVPKIINERVRELEKYSLRSIMQSTMFSVLNTLEVRKMFSEEIAKCLNDGRIDIDRMINRAVSINVSSKLDGVVPESTIRAIVQSLLDIQSYGNAGTQ